MGLQHQLLGIESTLLESSVAIAKETMDIFKKNHHLMRGENKTLEMFSDGDSEEALQEQNKSFTKIATTVEQRLDYTFEYWVKWLDCVLQKEITNQTVAKADLIVNGETILKDVPATFLLGLESKLKQIQKLILAAPTLDPSIDWVADEAAGKGVYKNPNKEVKLKTQKMPMHKSIAQATSQHKEQIHIYDDLVPVGKFISEKTCGHITPAQKNRYLKKIEVLMIAVSNKRHEANNCEASNQVIGKKLIDFIMS